MNITNYFSQQDKIEILTKQVDMIANFYRKFYKDEIKKLELKVKRHREMRYKEKAIKEKLLNSHVGTVKALLILKYKKGLDIELSDISELTYKDLSTVYKEKKSLGL
jgi:hypothetical protein